MPITHQPGTTLAFQQQFRPIGRIRTGMQVEYEKNGRKGMRPARLETFRLTSADERMLQRAAVVYGGSVEEWPESPDGDALQLVTATRELDVLVPGGQPLSQWYEMWGAGGCLRRCTGEEETLTGGPCLCPPDPADRTELAAKGDACKPTTRVNLLLPDMDLGAWLLVSHSYYAAVELPPVISLLAGMATQTARPVAAKLWIDQRRIKRPNQPPKEFSVPAIRTGVTWLDLIGAGGELGRPALASGRVDAQLPAGDTPLPDDPPVTNGHAPIAVSDVAVIEARTPISHPELVAALSEADIALEYAVERSKALFPREPGIPLTDEQRAALLADLTTPAPVADAL